MSDKPTIPPIPKRPPPKPVKIPPVQEKIATVPRIVNPYQGINRTHHNPEPIRPSQTSETDLEVVRHGVELKGLERRLEDVEDITTTLDTKLDSLTEVVNRDIAERKLEKAVKEDEKVKEDQKTKRFQALMVAIPLILGPILGFLGATMAHPAPNYKTSTVIVSEYTEEAAKCAKESHSKQEYVECIRDKQLKNTPAFEK